MSESDGEGLRGYFIVFFIGVLVGMGLLGLGAYMMHQSSTTISQCADANNTLMNTHWFRTYGEYDSMALVRNETMSVNYTGMGSALTTSIYGNDPPIISPGIIMT